MKVSALLLAQLLIASSAEARLFQRTRDANRAREKDDDTDRIINGVEAEEDRYSYMVSLKDNQGTFVLLLSLNPFPQLLAHTQMNAPHTIQIKVTFVEHLLLLKI
mmetsp:Transcript_18979/g.38230  ORF Transcript_18979/g.38230 Transcript_18979/m.38230 type:complete len:105 (-) Transcript_18979:1474-1788(-)